MPAGSKPLRALLVEDSPNDAELVLLELRRGGYQVSWERVQTGPDLERALEGDWEIVLYDYSMPSFSGKAWKSARTSSCSSCATSSSSRA